jgi:hypothetical protein
LLAFDGLASFAFVKSYAGTLVAALAIVAACSSNKPTTTPAPTNPPPGGNNPAAPTAPLPTTDFSTPGAPDARSAARAFLDAGKAQDLQALSAVWGSGNGPLRNMVSHDELEKRELVMMCFLRHSTDSIGVPEAAAGSRIIFPVSLTQGSVTRTTTLTTMLGPSSRWYVEKIDLRPIEPLCQKAPS